MGKGSSKKPKAKIKSSAPHPSSGRRSKPSRDRRWWISLGVCALLSFVAGAIAADLTSAPTPLIEVSAKGRENLVTFRNEVDKVLAQVGTKPTGTEGIASGFQMLPEFKKAVAATDSGGASDQQVIQQAELAQQAAKKAADDLDLVQIAVLSQGQPTRVMDEMYVARNNIRLALKQYEEIAKTIQRILELPEGEREDLIHRVLGWQGQADELLQVGYRSYLSALGAGGVPSEMAPPSPAPLPEGVPPFGVPGGEAPVPPEGG